MIGKRKLLALGGAGLALAPFAALAQGTPSWPSRPLRLVVPLAAGGNMDALTRLVGEKLTASLGQSVIVDNRPGATGMIGATAVAKAEPDGHTVLFAISSVVQSLRLVKTQPYSLSELTAVTRLADLPIGFAVAESLGVKTLAEFVALVKSQPGKLSYGSYGTASGGHIVGEFLKRATGMNIVHVPYRGEAPAIQDMLGGQIAAAFGSVGGLSQHPTKMRVVAVTGARRLTRFPALPTFDEAGVKLGGLTGWSGVFVPAATPAPVTAKLRSELVRVLALPDIVAKMLDFGFEPPGPEESFGAFVMDQYESWGVAIRDAGITPE